MTRSQALAALRRALGPALLAAAVMLALVLGLLLSRSPTYRARVAVVATPVVGADGSNQDYGAVVSSVLPAVPELAVSTDVLDRLRGRYPKMSQADLEQSVAVELVPASGVARITATGASRAETTAVLRAVTDVVGTSDLLSPAGTFRVLGDVGVRPTEVRPDPLLAAGLGALAAALVALLTVAAVQIARPRLLTVSDVERVVRSVAPAHVPVVTHDRRSATVDLLVLHLVAAAPAATRVVSFTAGPVYADGLVQALAERLQQRVLSRGVASGDGGDPDDGQPVASRPRTSATPRHAVGSTLTTSPAVVTVRLRKTSADELTATLLVAEQEGHEVGLVVAQ